MMNLGEDDAKTILDGVLRDHLLRGQRVIGAQANQHIFRTDLLHKQTICWDRRLTNAASKCS
jgi:hypothetical protein